MRHAAAILAAGLLAIGAQAQEGGPDPAQRVRDRLAAMKIDIDFANAKLDEVIAYFQEYSGLNFHLDTDAQKEGDESAKVTIKLKAVSMKTALKLILSPRDLGAVYRDGIILIQPKSKMGTKLVTLVYEVRDLTIRLRDFAGPRVELTVPGGAGAAIAGATFMMEEEPKGEITEDFLSDLIKTNIGDRSWDENAGASITQVSGLLIITQTRPVHDEIKRLLDMLRAFK
jgi:hypothetical protein